MNMQSVVEISGRISVKKCRSVPPVYVARKWHKGVWQKFLILVHCVSCCKHYLRLLPNLVEFIQWVSLKRKPKGRKKQRKTSSDEYTSNHLVKQIRMPLLV